MSPQSWLDIWALCRRDHGITWDEFFNLTLAQIEALEERRDIAIRHARYDAALVTSAILNANRPEGMEPVSPFDFLAGFDENPVEKERRDARRRTKKSIARIFNGLPLNTSREEFIRIKGKMLAGMRASGIEDAEDLFREVVPNL